MKTRGLGYFQAYAFYFAFSFVVLYFTYSSLIHIPFYHHDIYKFSVGGLDKLCRQNYGYENMLFYVRPLVALFDCGNFKLGTTLYHMSLLRFKCIILASMFASFIALWMYRREMSFWVSIFISTFIFCLPGMQTAMIMGTDALIASPFFAFLGALLVNKGFKNDFSWKIFRLNQLIFILFGIAFLFCSYLTYPAESAFFLLPALFLILFQPLTRWKLNRKIVFRDILIFVMTTISFFIIAKIVQHILMTFSTPANYAFNVNFVLGERVIGLMKVFPSLWSINFSSIYQAMIVYLTVIFAIFAATRMYKKTIKNSFYSLIQMIICVGLIVALSSITYVAQPTNMVFTRILFAYQVLGFFIIIWCIKTIIGFFSAKPNNYFLSLAGILLVVAAIYSNAIVTASALNDNMEFNYLVAMLNKGFAQQKKIKRIHFIGLPYESKDNFNGRQQRDDIYNINSSVYRQDSYYMVDAALKQFLVPHSYSLFNCALDEFQLKNICEKQCIDKAPSESIIVTYSRQHEPVNKTPHMLIVDMSSDAVNFPQNAKRKVGIVQK